MAKSFNHIVIPKVILLASNAFHILIAMLAIRIKIYIYLKAAKSIQRSLASDTKGYQT